MQKIVLIALAIFSMFASAEDVPSAPPAPVPAARGPTLDLSLEAARVAIETCTALEQKVAVSVIDSAGVLKVLQATDGAALRGVQSSTNKAVTALTFKNATSQLGEQAKTDQALADKIAANASFNIRAGGVLLKANNEIIGAIGVGGARGSEKDEACALAAVQRIQARLQ